MTSRAVLVDSPEIASRGDVLFPGSICVYANGIIPPEALGVADVVVASSDPARIASLCAALAAAGVQRIRTWEQDLTEFTTRQQVLDSAGGIKAVTVSAPQETPATSPPTEPVPVPAGADPDPVKAGSPDEPPHETAQERPQSDSDDWTTQVPAEGEEAIHRSVRISSALKRVSFDSGPVQATEWPEPANFWNTRTLPAFQERWIPPVIRPFVLNQARMVGCDPGITYLQALAFAAGCLSDDIKIRVRPNQDWAESARLWACVVGESGDGKSPSMRGIMRESRDLNLRIAQRSKEKQAAYKDEFDLWELDRKAWLAKKQKGEPAGERPTQPPRPVNELLYFNGTTAEGLLDQQEQSTRGTMLYADEMLGWLNSMDQYKSNGKGSDRQLWLSAWDGAEFVGILVGKLRTIPNTGVTIIGGSQPSAIARSAARMNLDSDGLLQRVLVYNSLGDADETGEHVTDRDAAARWREILVRLYDMKTHLDHCVFAENAHAIRREFDTWIASMRNVSGIPIAARQAMAKWRAYLPRIALTIHALEAADQGREAIPATIDDATTECAYAYMRECLFPHLLHFFDTLIDAGGGEDVASITAFSHYVMARGIDRIRPHQLASNWSHYRRFTTIQQRREFWARVEQSGWARPCGKPNPHTGIAQEFEVNPAIFDGRYSGQIAAAKSQVERYRAAMNPAMIAKQGRHPGED